MAQVSKNMKELVQAAFMLLVLSVTLGETKSSCKPPTFSVEYYGGPGKITYPFQRVIPPWNHGVRANVTLLSPKSAVSGTLLFIDDGYLAASQVPEFPAAKGDVQTTYLPLSQLDNILHLLTDCNHMRVEWNPDCKDSQKGVSVVQFF